MKNIRLRIRDEWIPLFSGIWIGGYHGYLDNWIPWIVGYHGHLDNR